MTQQPRDLYRERRLVEGYPGLSRLADEYFSGHLGINAGKFERQMTLLERLVDLRALDKRVLVIGCGPRPDMLKGLIEHGYDAIGVDVVPEFVRLAAEYAGGEDRVRLGSADALPLPDASQGAVLLDSVLEHVDSADKTLAEIYRVLKPGGACFVSTTNRWRLSPVGRTDEYRVPFFNWLPAVVRESYVFQHLHYRPELANFTTRPAVHWFSYSELCRLGRRAGFAQFYSPLDLMEEDDPRFSLGFKRRMLRPFLRIVKYRPWLRALALTQFASIYMWKRADG